MTKLELISEKLKNAPDDILQEVLDFIGYLEMKRNQSSKQKPIENEEGDMRLRLDQLESRLERLEKRLD